MNGLANISSSLEERRRFTAAHATARALMMAQGQQTISVVSLSKRIPDQYIAQVLAEGLCQVSNRSVLLVQLVVSEGNLSLKDWRTVYPGLNGEFGLARQVKIGPGRAPSVRIQISDATEDPTGIRSLIEHCQQHFHYVIFHVGIDVPAPLLTEVIEHGDTA